MAQHYDIGDALSRIENILLASMGRNLHRHLHEEQDEGFRWSMWQAEQMASLGKWSARNLKTHSKDFTRINNAAISLLQSSGKQAELAEEERILQSGIQHAEEYFSVPDDKMSSLLTAVRHDLSRAEHSVLRQADDMYRKAIFDANVYLQTGSGDLKKAIDMAVQDMYARGIRSVAYRNGRRVEASVYARMTLRTANVRAALMGEGKARDKFGVHTVIVPRSGIACEKCVPWMGKILVDDVYASGTAQEAEELGVPLLSAAIRQGFLHPQCDCFPQTFKMGISKMPEVSDADREDAVRRYKLTQKQRYNERNIRKWKRAEKAATDETERKAAKAKVRSWQKANKALCDANLDVLRRDTFREKIYDLPSELIVPDVIEKPAEPESKPVVETVTENTKAVQETEPEVEFIENGGENFTETLDNSPESDIMEMRMGGAFTPLAQGEAVPVLREESEAWVSSLTSEEVRAVKKYTKNSGDPRDDKFYQRLNAMLRGDRTEDETLRYYANIISAALKKNVVRHDILCYRSMGFNPFEGVQVGELIFPGQFMSTSITRNGALNGKFKIVIRVRPGAVGAYIELLSRYPKQREFLLDKGCVYEVLAISENMIELEVLT